MEVKLFLYICITNASKKRKQIFQMLFKTKKLGVSLRIFLEIVYHSRI